MAGVATAALGLTTFAAPAPAAPAPTPFTTPADSALNPAPAPLRADQQAAVAQAKVASAKNPAGVYVVQLAGAPLAAWGRSVSRRTR